MTAARGGELHLIDAFLAPFGARRGKARLVQGSGVLLGPGSDCAVMKISPSSRLVATTDAAMEGVHFELGLGAPEDAGHKALAMNLSDLAAAGARPRWFLCALGVPRAATDPAALAARFARGMAPLARAHACALVGGNVTSASQWSLTITALGEARKPLSRAGGRAGDALVLCGRLGLAAQGLLDLRAGKRGTRTTRAQLRPTPLVHAGLAAAPLASACIDISDGLLRDLGHLAEASGCGAQIELSALPKGAPTALVLTGGEDYALLFAVRPERLSRLLAALARAQQRATPIGRLVQKPGLALFENGEARRLPARLGFDHLGGRE